MQFVCQYLFNPLLFNERYSVDLFTHSQRQAYMDLVENSGGGGHQEIEEPQVM